MTNKILFSVNEKGIATLTLNRPEIHNAFDDELVHDMLHILKKLNDDTTIRILILRAEGKSFSAGADLNWMKRVATYTYEENIKDALALAELMQTLKFLNHPTLARVQGPVFGGGVGLVACCDMAVVSETATFCLSEVKIGLSPAVISPFVISAIGERAARRYFLTAESIDANEALRLGLATEVVALDQLDTIIENIIQHVLRNSPQAINATKKLINRVSKNPYDPANIQLNAEAIATSRISAEGQEGLTAFLTKRKPSWDT